MPNSNLSQIKTYKRRIGFFSELLKFDKDNARKFFLFVGCGSGLEALCLKRKLRDSVVIGIDLKREAFSDEAKKLSLVVSDCLFLPFLDAAFDYCYCYHVLEHVINVERALDEMKRVLKPDGFLFIATPNRRRLVGYICSAQKVALSSVIKWNVIEWLARLKGDFIPSKCHCGFYEEELRKLLNSRFMVVKEVSAEYALYISRGTILYPIVLALCKLGIHRILKISIVFYCHGTQR